MCRNLRTAGFMEASVLLPSGSERFDLMARCGSKDDRITPGAYLLEVKTVRSLRLLVSGVSLILIGLTTAVLVKPGGMWWLPTAPQPVYQLNMFGEPFASGWPFVVTSISAQIGDGAMPGGKIFKASVLTGAIMILVSDYPAYLSNVFIGNPKDHKFPMINSLRAYAVPVGIIVVALCPITQVDLMTVGEMVVMYGFHMVGALGAIVVYLVCESHDLRDPTLSLAKTEKYVRVVLAWLVVLCLVAFIIAEAIGFVPLGICCDDEFLPVTEKAIHTAARNNAYVQVANNKAFMEMFKNLKLDPSSSSPLYKGLLNTAHGPFLAVRVMGVWAEYIMFLCMLLSHVAVWYYSPQHVGKDECVHVLLEAGEWQDWAQDRAHNAFPAKDCATDVA